MPRAQNIVMPVLNPEDFADEEEYLYHLDICQRLARSLAKVAEDPSSLLSEEEVWGPLREKHGL